MTSQIIQGTKDHIAQISINKFNTSHVVSLSKASVHNGRTGATEKHVDERRSHINDIMVGDKTSHFFCDVINRVTGKNYTPEEASKLDPNKDLYYKDKTKVRKNAVLAFECKCQYPGDLIYANIDEYGKIYVIPEGEEIDTNPIENGGRGDFLYPANMKEFEQWKKLTLNFVEQRFGGKENVLQAVCHMDESIPHLHIIGTPICKDKEYVEKLSMRTFINGRKDTAELQTEYAAAVSELGYQRGEKRGYNINSSTATHARALMGKAISSAPQTPEAYEKLIANMSSKDGMELMQSLYLRAAVAEEDAKDIPRLQRILVKKQDYIDKLSTEIQNRDEEIQALKKQVGDLSREHKRRECELQGVRMCDDKEVVEAYLAYQDNFIEDGARHFNRMGWHVDLDFNHHDDRIETYVDKNNNGHDDRIEE